MVKCPDGPGSRGQVELCCMLLSTPLPLLALVCTLDCNSASLVQLRFSSVWERNWLGETGSERVTEGEETVRMSVKIRLQKMLKLYLQCDKCPVRKRSKFNMSLSPTQMNNWQLAMT